MMLEDISVSNLELIFALKLFIAKHINELSKEEQDLLNNVINRLKNAEY
jgi:hypothetical protein